MPMRGGRAVLQLYTSLEDNFSSDTSFIHALSLLSTPAHIILQQELVFRACL